MDCFSRTAIEFPRFEGVFGPVAAEVGVRPGKALEADMSTRVLPYCLLYLAELLPGVATD